MTARQAAEEAARAQARRDALRVLVARAHEIARARNPDSFRDPTAAAKFDWLIRENPRQLADILHEETNDGT